MKNLLLPVAAIIAGALLTASSGCNSEPKTDAKAEAAMRDNFKGQPDPSKAPPEQRAKIEAIMKANGAGPSRNAGATGAASTSP